VLIRNEQRRPSQSRSSLPSRRSHAIRRICIIAIGAPLMRRGRGAEHVGEEAAVIGSLRLVTRKQTAQRDDRSSTDASAPEKEQPCRADRNAKRKQRDTHAGQQERHGPAGAESSRDRRALISFGLGTLGHQQRMYPVTNASSPTAAHPHVRRGASWSCTLVLHRLVEGEESPPKHKSPALAGLS
jgi:hypothetical protein